MKHPENYLVMLEHSFTAVQRHDCPPESRLEYLADYVFEFTTYDGDVGAAFARRAVETCKALTEGKTYEHIRDQGNYTWYLVMCNMPFFNKRLSWGSSVRGAWWDPHPKEQFEMRGYMFYDGDDQIADELTFTRDQWADFIGAIVEFASREMDKP